MTRNGHISRDELRDAFGDFNVEIDIDALHHAINDEDQRTQDMIRTVNTIMNGHGIRHIDTMDAMLAIVDMGDDYIASMAIDRWGNAQILCVADLYPRLREDD